MARMKKQNEKYKNEWARQVENPKGRLRQKNEHPDGLTTFKGNSGKNRGNTKKKHIPRWVENPKRRSRQKWDKKKGKINNKCKHAKSIGHRCDTQSVLDGMAFSSSSTIKRFHSLQVDEWDTVPCPQQWSWCVFKRRHPQKRNFCKYMSEHEPLRAQYSNVSSVSAKLCLQIANHHAFQNIHTCIIMHLTCSCIR